MKLAGDPSVIASAVSVAARDGPFFPAHDGPDRRPRRWRASVGHGLVVAAAGTRAIRPSGDRTHADPAPVSVAIGEGISVAIRAGLRGNVTEQRRLSSILDDWRVAERRLEDAHDAADAAEVARLRVEAASFADEYRNAFESALARSANGEIRGLRRGQMNESPRAICIPRNDPGFAERVRSLLDGSHSEEPVAAAVQALLRETYPLALISPRHRLAALDGARVWYAFRDGSAVPKVDGQAS